MGGRDRGLYAGEAADRRHQYFFLEYRRETPLIMASRLFLSRFWRVIRMRFLAVPSITKEILLSRVQRITPAAFGNALRSRNDISMLMHTNTAGIIDVSVHQFIVVECLVLKV